MDSNYPALEDLNVIGEIGHALATINAPMLPSSQSPADSSSAALQTLRPTWTWPGAPATTGPMMGALGSPQPVLPSEEGFGWANWAQANPNRNCMVDAVEWTNINGSRVR